MKDLLLIFICVVCCQLSSGTPATACKGLTPDHGVMKTSTPPYSINIVPDIVDLKGTQPIDVVLKADDGRSFIGFILLAIEAESHELLGTFSFDTGDKLPSGIRRVDCGDGSNATATLTKNTTPITELALNWKSTANYEGFVLFLVSFIENETTFYAGIMSKAIYATKTEGNVPRPIEDEIWTGSH